MRNRLRCVFILAAALAFVVSATPSPAQTWPQRPVKFLVTLGPGSGVDIGTRLLADRLSKRWGQPVVVENRPGGDGLVAISAMIAAQDDHVLLASPTSSFTAHPRSLGCRTRSSSWRCPPTCRCNRSPGWS